MGNSSNWSEHRDPKAYAKKHKKSYSTKDQILPGVTRMKQTREMIVGFWSKGTFDHASIFIAYFSEKQGSKLVGRAFSVELFRDKVRDKNILSIKGPLYGTSARQYNCKEFYLVQSSMDELIEIAKQTMGYHGKYKSFSNNCRHFCNRYLANIKEACYPLSVNVKAKVIDQYIETYVQHIDHNLCVPNLKICDWANISSVNIGSPQQPPPLVLDDQKHDMNTEHSEIDELYHSEEHFIKATKEKSYAEPMTFNSVRRNYPLD